MIYYRQKNAATSTIIMHITNFQQPPKRPTAIILFVSAIYIHKHTKYYLLFRCKQLLLTISFWKPVCLPKEK